MSNRVKALYKETKNCLLVFGLISSIDAVAQVKPHKGNSGTYTKLVWSDEFSKNGLPDNNKWGYETGYKRNKELQYYTVDRKENAVLEKGNLVIKALNDSIKIDNKVIPITSASITTQGKQSWIYGRIEVRAKVPSSLGTWPAIWMLGDNISEVGWPDCGEIDILEHVGYMPDTVHFNIHTKKYNHVKNTGKGLKVGLKDADKQYHVYAVEWFKDRIDWYLDDKKVFTYNNEGTGTDSWPFDKPQYLIINFAFGGAWGGAMGVDISSLPQNFMIDYVRVYQ